VIYLREPYGIIVGIFYNVNRKETQV